MVKKLDNLRIIDDTGVILIIRLDNAEEAAAVANAAIDGGIRALEITLSIPGALAVVEDLANRYRGDGIVIGAGTVLDGPSAQRCIAAGAELLVSPNVDATMIEVANRYQAVSVAGAFTPTEILGAATAGADIVKLFPAEFVGPPYVKSVLAPLAGIPIAPAGGVTEENVGEWFSAGVAAVGVGSAITKAGRERGELAAVSKAAARFLSAVQQARA